MTFYKQQNRNKKIYIKQFSDRNSSFINKWGVIGSNSDLCILYRETMVSRC